MPMCLRERVMTDSELTVVSTFRTPAEAQVAQGMLEDAGIQTLVRSDNAGGMYPSLAEVELLVRVEDLDRATELLRDPGDAVAPE